MLRSVRMMFMLVVATVLTVSAANASPSLVRDSVSRHNHAEQGFFQGNPHAGSHHFATPQRWFRLR